MKVLIAFLAFNMYVAHADKIGDTNGNTQAPAIKASTPAAHVEEAEAGEDDVQVASADSQSVAQITARTTHGYSWRNTQAILMGMHKIDCRLGGINAKTAAIPALSSVGFCNQLATGKKISSYPAGSVWVFTNGRHGNTAVKLKDGTFYDNRKMSAPPAARGKLAAIMVPGCGKKVKKCGEFEVKMKDAAQGNQEPIQMAEAGPSAARLAAEQMCGYKLAAQDIMAFNECVDSKMAH